MWRRAAVGAFFAAACSVGATGDGGAFASVGGGGFTGEASEDAGASDSADASDGGSASDSANASSDASTSADGSDSSGALEGSSGDAADGSSSSEGGPPDVGPACGGGGAIAMPGAVGPAAANQYCPQTDFVVQIDGAPGPIADVDVSIDGVLANTSQNRLWLISPAGTQVLLFDRRGSFLTDDFVGTLFDDDAPTAVASAPGPFHGCFAPEQSLAAFTGQDADGPWILRVETCLYETSIGDWQLHLDF
jgi:proprotein convertase P-domain-containing protein